MTFGVKMSKLVDQPNKPSQGGDVPWPQEINDGLEVGGVWNDAIGGNMKPHKLHLSGNLKFLFGDCDAKMAAIVLDTVNA